MNFQLTKEQEFVQKMVREFAKTEADASGLAWVKVGAPFSGRNCREDG